MASKTMTFKVLGTGLDSVRVVRENHVDTTYTRYLWEQMFKHAPHLKHPTKNSHPNVLKMAIKFRFVNEPWTTFGNVIFRFYGVDDRQVRARIRYGSSPAKLKMGPETKISFHLDETPIVVPALLKSLSDFSFDPLKATGLFEGLKDTPEQTCKSWSEKGRQASEWRRTVSRESQMPPAPVASEES